MLAEGDAATAKRYQDHVLSQAVTLLQHRRIAAVFTTPRLLELLGERVDLPAAGVRGVLCGGTSMRWQRLRMRTLSHILCRTRLSSPPMRWYLWMVP